MPIWTPVRSTVLTLFATAPALAQAAGAITPIPNTCTTFAQGCSGSPVIGGNLSWASVPGPPMVAGALLAFDFGGPAWNGNAVPQLLPTLFPSWASCVQRNMKASTTRSVKEDSTHRSPAKPASEPPAVGMTTLMDTE